jgi:hypothetical protein
VAYTNVVDGTSTTVSPATPGMQLDLRYRTTKRRAALGVPVRFAVCANATVAGDTGFVKLVDSAGADKIVVPITKSGEQWYVVDGYLPATNAKYDIQAGGNLTGSLTYLASSLFELMDYGPNVGTVAQSIGTLGLTADGTVVTGSGVTGTLSQTIAAITTTATGTVDVQGTLSQTIANLSISAAGTVTGSWTLDATSGKGTPLTQTEAQSLLSAAGVSSPSVTSLWKFGTPASGNVSDTIGAITLTESGAHNYQTSVTGWSIKSLQTTAGTAGLLENTAGVSNVSANSYTMFLLAKTGSVAATRSLMRLGAGFDSDACIELTTTPRAQVGHGGTSSRTTGGSDPTAAVRWWVLRVGTDVDAFTAQEKILGGTKGCSGTRVTFGGDNVQTWFPNTTDYMLAFITPVAMTDAQIKSALQSLGETVPWT